MKTNEKIASLMFVKCAELTLHLRFLQGRFMVQADGKMLSFQERISVPLETGNCVHNIEMMVEIFLNVSAFDYLMIKI